MKKIKNFLVIYAIAFVLIIPCLFVTSESVLSIAFGVGYISLLASVLSLTGIGRAYCKAFYVYTVRFEIFALGKCCASK